MALACTAAAPVTGTADTEIAVPVASFPSAKPSEANCAYVSARVAFGETVMLLILVSRFNAPKDAAILAAVSTTVNDVTEPLDCKEAACAAVPDDPDAMDFSTLMQMTAAVSPNFRILYQFSI